MTEGMGVEEKLRLAAELQEAMTPQELRQALVDLIERLAKGDKGGTMLGSTLKQAMTALHPREKFSLLQAALASFRPAEHERFLQTMVASWGSKRSEQIFGAYTILGEGERLKFLSLCLPEMGDDEKSFLGLGRAMASKGIMTVEAAQAAMEAEAAAEAAAQKQQAALAALMAGKAAEEAKEASAAQKVRLRLMVRLRLRVRVWVRLWVWVTVWVRVGVSSP